MPNSASNAPVATRVNSSSSTCQTNSEDKSFTRPKRAPRWRKPAVRAAWNFNREARAAPLPGPHIKTMFRQHGKNGVHDRETKPRPFSRSCPGLRSWTNGLNTSLDFASGMPMPLSITMRTRFGSGTTPISTAWRSRLAGIRIFNRVASQIGDRPRHQSAIAVDRGVITEGAQNPHLDALRVSDDVGPQTSVTKSIAAKDVRPASRSPTPIGKFPVPIERKTA